MQLDARLEVPLTSFGLAELGSLLGLVPEKSGSHEGTKTDTGARQGGWYLGKERKKADWMVEGSLALEAL